MLVPQNMQPSKGKALILLKQLNALVRRVSKTGGTAKFNGRILNFLSGAFPLGERSGVNLRGEYGPKWEDVPDPIPSGDPAASEPGGVDDPQIADGPTPSPSLPDLHKKAEFYKKFWSVQTPISNPPEFFSNKKSGEEALEVFKSNVGKILSVFMDATKKERMSTSVAKTTAMAPPLVADAVAGMKRKRDDIGTKGLKSGLEIPAVEEDASKDYFFAKFLTNFDLLELEVGSNVAGT
jgi:hypothetical protein